MVVGMVSELEIQMLSGMPLESKFLRHISSVEIHDI
jgi:hypothetical protein